MAEITEAALRQQLKTDELDRLYLIHGEEAFFVSKYTDRLVEKAVEWDNGGFNFDTFDGRSSNIRDVCDLALQYPMMADRRCVLADDFNLTELDENELKIVENCFKNLPDSTVLIFRQEINPIVQKGSGGAMLKLFKKYGSVLKLSKLKGAELFTALMKRAKSGGMALDRTTAEYLTVQCGNDYTLLANEIDKLCAYASSIGESAITAAHIDLIASKTAEAKVWELNDFMLSGQFDKAYRVFDVLKANKTPAEFILGVLVGAYSDLYLMKAASLSGLTIGDVMTKIDGKKEYPLKKASQRARRLEMSTIRTYLELLSEADCRLKRSRDDPMIIIEELMVKLMKAK